MCWNLFRLASALTLLTGFSSFWKILSLVITKMVHHGRRNRHTHLTSQLYKNWIIGILQGCCHLVCVGIIQNRVLMLSSPFTHGVHLSWREGCFYTHFTTKFTISFTKYLKLPCKELMSFHNLQKLSLWTAISICGWNFALYNFFSSSVFFLFLVL